jgi:hypothetical protein
MAPPITTISTIKTKQPPQLELRLIGAPHDGHNFALLLTGFPQALQGTNPRLSFGGGGGRGGGGGGTGAIVRMVFKGCHPGRPSRHANCAGEMLPAASIARN